MSKKSLFIFPIAAICLALNSVPAFASHWWFSRGTAFATSIEIEGPLPDEPFQVVEGYADNAYTQTRGGAIKAKNEAIELRGRGVYVINIEGTMFLKSDDNFDPDAGALFGIGIPGEEPVPVHDPAFRDGARAALPV